jgi:hypothetical protein
VIRDLRGEARRSAEGRFVHPRYGGYSFADIPGSIASLLGVDSGRSVLDGSILEPVRSRGFDHVLLFLIDGFGFNDWLERAAEEPWLARFAERGSLTSLTAVFPSTTAAALTTLSTGLPPLQHGLPEWMIYVEELDEIIFTLPFRRWNSRQRDELAALGYDGSLLFEGRTIFDTLAAAGIPSVAFCHSAYAQSAYSLASKRGSRSVGFLGAADLAVRIADELEAATAPTFFYVYWDHLDTLEHAHAPRSREARVEISLMSRLLPTQLPRLLGPAGRRAAERTLLVVTADHGQVPVRAETTIYLTDSPELNELLRPRKSGPPILPTGSLRDVFVHVRAGKVDRTVEVLRQFLAEKAVVLRTEEALQLGLFGNGTPSERFLRRVGDVLVLPYPQETVWSQYPGVERPQRLRGHHGGLSADEMFVPFAEAILADVLEAP